MKIFFGIALVCIGLSLSAQTIKLEHYMPNMQICPNTETFFSFSARDQWNNKKAGEFVFALYVNGSLNTTIKVHAGSITWDNSDPKLPPVTLTNLNLHTGSDKRVNFYVGKVDTIGINNLNWIDGFDLQSNNIDIVARFKDDFLSPWVEETFHIRSNVIPPGEAVVQGTNDLYFCSANQIQTVTLANFPTDSNNSNYCFWHHRWVWELPLGWKVTNPSGNLSTASNTFQGGLTVKIQAPMTLPSSANLNVRSQDVWPYPINTSTQINFDNAPLAESITYNDLGYLPVEICYEQNNDLGTFHVALPTGTNAHSYYWETNAGTISNPTTSLPSVAVNFNSGTGLNKYIRVKTTNSCGTSNWKTFFFDLLQQPLGCSGSGGPMMFSVSTYPNPTSNEINIELIAKNESVSEIPSDKYIAYLINSDLEVVKTQQLSGKSTQILIRDLPQGTYYLRIVSNKKSHTQQIIIK